LELPATSLILSIEMIPETRLFKAGQSK